MINLLFGRRQKVEAEPKKPLERPGPQKVTVVDSTREALAEYAKVSAQVGFKPAQVRLEELKLFLADNNIPLYDNTQVDHYLVTQAKERGMTYRWIPLREQDKGMNCVPLAVTFNPRGQDFGRIEKHWGPYTQIIPLSVMATIAKVSATFPDAHFYVSDISHYPDPFLSVAINQCQLMVIDFWNEPGFRPV